MKVTAPFNMSVDVECPHCNHYFDLFDISQLTDEGHIHKALLEGEDFGTTKEDEPLECECPECEKEIEVAVWW